MVAANFTTVRYEAEGKWGQGKWGHSTFSPPLGAGRGAAWQPPSPNAPPSAAPKPPTEDRAVRGVPPTCPVACRRRLTCCVYRLCTGFEGGSRVLAAACQDTRSLATASLRPSAPRQTRPPRRTAKCCSASPLAVRASSPCRFGSRLPGPWSQFPVPAVVCRLPVPWFQFPVPAVRAVHVSRIFAETLTSTAARKNSACFDQK